MSEVFNSLTQLERERQPISPQMRQVLDQEAEATEQNLDSSGHCVHPEYSRLQDIED